MTSFIKSKRLARLIICLTTACVLVLTGCETTVPDSESTAKTEPLVAERPASFSVSNLVLLKPEVKINENVGISVLVTNDGDEAGSFTVELRINGEVVDHKDVSLAGGESATVSFKNAQERPGTYTVSIGHLSATFVVVPPPSQPDGPDIQEPVVTPPGDEWVIPQGTGTNLRAVHMGGNWGTNTNAVNDPPEKYFRYLRDLNVNWVGISVSLHVEGSMDSTVELQYGGVPFATFRDDVLHNLIGSFRQHGFNVYIHIAFEGTSEGEYAFDRWQMGDPFMHAEDPDILPQNWPWRTDHPEHEEFVAEFWQTYTDCLVHIARIAEEEGVGMLTLGTETDRLFRSRTGGRWPDNYLDEMQAMVAALRDVYTGLLSYEMLHFTLEDRDMFGSCSDYLYEDLGLDFVAVSAYFHLTSTNPNRVMGVEELEAAWENIFDKHIIPLQNRNPGKPIIFTEFGYTDVIETPYNPSARQFENSARQFENKVFSDVDNNGLDDGEEAQANCVEAFYNVMENHQGIVTGAFLWDVMMSTEFEYQQGFGQMRTFNIRGKLAEDVVRQQYADWLN